MRNTNEQWEVKVSDLKKQLMVKEDSLQKIASELERIRSITQAKSKECQQKTDLIQKLEDNISDKNCEIDDLRQSSQNDVLII
jgi:predicted RNase H-like nuclease (RuvC/YqgF family)